MVSTQKKKRGKGRPSKFSQALADKIVLAVRAGNYVETAAAFAGVGPDTMRDWLRTGQRKGRGPEYAFNLALENAIAEGEVRDLETIRKASEDLIVDAVTTDPKGNTTRTKELKRHGNWTAAAWRLERRFPKKWGRKDALALTGEDGGPLRMETRNVNVDLSVLTPQQLAELENILELAAPKALPAGSGEPEGEG